MVKREKREFLLLLIFGAIILLSANGSLAITDPVESNYALTAKEMVASGDYLSPRIFGNYWYDKPAFFYWEMIASCLILGVNEFALRFPSAVMGLLSLALLYFFTRRLYGHRTALLAGGLFASSVGFWYVGKAIITDMTLFFFMSATLVFFYLGYDSGKRVRYYAAFFFAGLAVLTKGPIGFLLPGLLLAVYLVLRKDAKELLRLRWGGGMVIFLLVGGSWYYAMYSLHGADFLGTFFGTHNFLRATVSEHPGQNVWYYYILLFLASFFPSPRLRGKGHALPTRLGARHDSRLSVHGNEVSDLHLPFGLPHRHPGGAPPRRFRQEAHEHLHRCLRRLLSDPLRPRRRSHVPREKRRTRRCSRTRSSRAHTRHELPRTHVQRRLHVLFGQGHISADDA